MTHICVSKLTIIGSDNGLSPGRRQAIIWTNAGILLTRPLGTNFNEMVIEILTVTFMKMRLKVSSAEWRPFCLGLIVLNYCNISSTVWNVWCSEEADSDQSTHSGLVTQYGEINLHQTWLRQWVVACQHWTINWTLNKSFRWRGTHMIVLEAVKSGNYHSSL